jgi:GntR family transcriptional regulator
MLMRLSLDYFRLPVESALPLYRQIQQNIIELIDNDLIDSGDALPSERQLSEVYGVNRMTVRQAVDRLVEAGLVQRRQGAGTFVTDSRPVQNFTPTVVGFSQRMSMAGMNPSSRLLHRDVITSEPIIAHRLNTAADSPLIMLKRLRLVNDEPLMIETSYLDAAMFADLMQIDLESESLYRILEQNYGTCIVEAEHTMEPTLPTAFEAHHLGIECSMPTLLIRVLAYSADRVPVEVSKGVVRGDRCRYFFRVNTRTPITK